MLRKAAVAGTFYPEAAKKLNDYFSSVSGRTSNDSCVFAIVPHAGYVYSGEAAMKTLDEIKISDNVILLGPNHTGLGQRVSVYPSGEWETPLGNVPVNKDIADELTRYDMFSKDTLAHEREHSLEVIVPMLKFKNPDITINPITIGRLSVDECQKAGEILFNVIGNKEDVTVIVSSDMNHFENAALTEEKDFLAIKKILDMDEEGLINEVIQKDISMCGIIPAAIAIAYAKLKKYSETRLIIHTHSGHVSGDNDRCVGYAGIVVR